MTTAIAAFCAFGVGLLIGFAWGTCSAISSYLRTVRKRATSYVEPPLSEFLDQIPYDGTDGPFCPGCNAPKGHRHGQWCPVND
jgi:hypothetical protein